VIIIITTEPILAIQWRSSWGSRRMRPHPLQIFYANLCKIWANFGKIKFG